MCIRDSFLVAPATLGLIAPMYANATEVNLNEISNYSDVESIEFANSFNNDEASLNPLLAGGEGLIDDHSHDGSFSETTQASFTANFYLGATDTDDTLATGTVSDKAMAGYDFQIGLTTSFTDGDSLAVTIDSGNAGGVGYAEFNGDNTTDALTVDGISYTFPVGDATFIVGDNTDGSALFSTACVYGGPSNTLDDCGNVNAGITNGGAMAGASYDFGNGFTTAIGYAGSETSVMTEETTDAYGFNAAYTGDSYGLSVTYGVLETSATEENTYTAFNGYYDADGFPSVSIGYETGDLGGEASTVDETESFFVGLSSDIGPGSAGVALGHTTTEGSDEEYMYEVYYDYPVNDGMTITPLLFVQEVATSGVDDTVGVMVKTSFSF